MNDQVSNSDEAAGGAGHEPCHVGVVFALSQEAGGLIDRLAGAVGIAGAEFTIQEGGLAGRRVAVIVSGPGRKAARRAAEVLIAGHAPRVVVSSGFAGGLVDAVKRNEFVVASELVDSAGARVVVGVDAAFRGDAATVGVHVGRFVTVDEIVTTPEAKRALGEKHDAIAVDMESLAVAEVCAREGVRFAAVRIVSDAVGDALPAEVSNLIKQKSLAGRLGAVAGAMFNRPSSIKDIYKLKEDALIASDRLAKFLEGVVPRIVDAA
jgi:adenosylhomocysteine nucleosidase